MPEQIELSDVCLLYTSTEAEQEELKRDWLRQMKEGWGLSLLEYPIHTERGELHIGLWDEDYGTALCIMTEEELKRPDLPEQETGRIEPLSLIHIFMRVWIRYI